ncbi:uncharacterized protein LOC114306980 [Camellia sinensis]|uniref:uncharacterized protein LOC114306980 n=1 Tax=Camellia sinensis TaxID=4442 RepID=UPI0010364E38|nr:uncharacterized protein LOC114306980 [Camellia sinensis]
MVTIQATERPFEIHEAHYSDAIYFTKLAVEETLTTSKPRGVKIPRWEDIKDDKEPRTESITDSESKEEPPDNDIVIKPKVAPECMQDGPKPQPEQLIEIDLSDGQDAQRPVFISSSLSLERQEQLLKLISRYSDVFAWSYKEMPGLDPDLVSHYLDVFPNSKPIKQAARKYHPDLEEKIKEEIEKLQQANYVDDLAVKSKKEKDHLRDLEKVFKRCWKFKMRMNPLKCAFGVTAGKFLGFLVHRHGIEADEDNVKSIKAMPPPHSQKELKKFLGKVSCIRRFIPALAEISAPFGSLLKGDAKFEWNQEHQKAFERIKAALTSPQTMIAPQPGVPLMLYLTSTPKSIGALLVQDIDGAERPVYYISRKIRGAEVQYTPIERHCLALVFTAQKLKHYFLAHTSKRKPTQAAPYSLVYGSEAVLPIELETPSARMALASGMVLEPRTTRLEALEEKHDRAAKVMERYHESIARAYNQTVVPRKFEEGDLVWKIVDPIMRGQPLPKFSPKWEGPYKVVQASSSGYYKLLYLDFHCSNNEAEYEALILGLIAAEKHNIKKIRIRGDSKLIVKQKVEIEHVPRSDKKFSDALATLGARVDIPEEEATIIIKKRTEPSIISEDKDLPEDWRGEVLEQLISKVRKLTMAKLAQFIIIQGELYFRGGTRFLARCVGQ